MSLSIRGNGTGSHALVVLGILCRLPGSSSALTVINKVSQHKLEWFTLAEKQSLMLFPPQIVPWLAIDDDNPRMRQTKLFLLFPLSLKDPKYIVDLSILQTSSLQSRAVGPRLKANMFIAVPSGHIWVKSLPSQRERHGPVNCGSRDSSAHFQTVSPWRGALCWTHFYTQKVTEVVVWSCIKWACLSDCRFWIVTNIVGRSHPGSGIRKGVRQERSKFLPRAIRRTDRTDVSCKLARDTFFTLKHKNIFNSHVHIFTMGKFTSNCIFPLTLYARTPPLKFSLCPVWPHRRSRPRSLQIKNYVNKWREINIFLDKFNPPHILTSNAMWLCEDRF